MFAFLLFATGAAHAQQTNVQLISGRVLDETGETLIGANVVVTGTAIGTVTDLDGGFTINAPTTAQTITVSYTGYAPQTIAFAEANDLTITLAQDALGLEEVVVTGYAPTRRKDLTGSVVSIDGDLANREAGATVQSALRQAPGVVVQQSSGAPGSGMVIRVRGATSITASNEPLYVVDGVPIVSESFARTAVGGQGSNSLADINPNDIASIEVLKDASTTAIYGSRAANGVVLITTKRGVAGQTKINLNASYGINSTIKTIDVVNTEQYQGYIFERYGTRNISALDPSLDSTVSNNWQDLIFQNNPIQNYNFSVSGGTTKNRYFTSLNYDDNQGVLDGTRFRRYNARLNLDNQINDKLISSLQIGYNYSDNKILQNDNNIYGAVSAAILLPPAVVIRTDEGRYGSAFGLENPIAAITEYSNNLRTNRLIGNGSLSYLPTQWLTLTTRLGIDALDLRETVFEPSLLQSSPAGVLNEGSTRNMRIVNEYLASVSKSFGQTNMVLTGGAIYQNNTRDRLYFSKSNLPDNTPSGDAAATPTDVLGDKTSDVLQSYIFSANFKILGDLFVNGSFRADGSSRFVNDRWGYFPGIAAGYDFSRFVPQVQQLKLRASFGQTGNNNIGNFDSRALFSGTRRYLDVPGTGPSQIGNADLRWETTQTTDVGIDAAFLNNKVALSVGYYDKYTTDLLLNRPLPTTSGFNSVLENIGEMRNTGFEFLVTIAPYSTKDLTWRTSFNGAFNKNEVVKLFDDQPFDAGFANRVAVGQPLGAFYGWVTDGIFQNKAEVEAGPKFAGLNVAPGDFRFKDLNGRGPDGELTGMPDGKLDGDDRTFIGQALPKFTGGIDNLVSYKGVSLQAYFQFNLGNSVYNNNLAFAEGLNSVFAPTVRSYEGAWREEGDGDKYPRIGGGVASTNNRRTSDRFLEDGSFVRLKSAKLSYDFASLVPAQANVRSLIFYVSGTNLITWTDYSWFDPEVNTFGAGNNASLGTDFLTQPQFRTVQAGINLGF